MEKKNMVLLTVIAGATFLVAMVGATFAFFTATVQDNRTSSGDTGKTSITAGSVASTTIVGSVAGQFTATNVYPGHMEVAALSVKADNSQNSEQTKTNIAIKYDVTKNDFANKEIKVSIYKKENTPVSGVSKAGDSNGNNKIVPVKILFLFPFNYRITFS